MLGGARGRPANSQSGVVLGIISQESAPCDLPLCAPRHFPMERSFQTTLALSVAAAPSPSNPRGAPSPSVSGCQEQQCIAKPTAPAFSCVPNIVDSEILFVDATPVTMTGVCIGVVIPNVDVFLCPEWIDALQNLMGRYRVSWKQMAVGRDHAAALFQMGQRTSASPLVQHPPNSSNPTPHPLASPTSHLFTSPTPHPLTSPTPWPLTSAGEQQSPSTRRTLRTTCSS